MMHETSHDKVTTEIWENLHLMGFCDLISSLREGQLQRVRGGQTQTQRPTSLASTALHNTRCSSLRLIRNLNGIEVVTAASEFEMTTPNPPRIGRSQSDSGLHFTWLLSTEREDDLDMISDDDGDDAMLQLDEEYLGEMQRRAELRDQEREREVDSDFDQVELDDRVARAEYDDSNGLISPRHSFSGERGFQNGGAPPISTAHRILHHIPCTTCCFPLEGSHHKDCDRRRILKNTKRFCAPNLELLRTLRVVKHIRIFRKILKGTSKASYYQESKDASAPSSEAAGDGGLGLQESREDNPDMDDMDPSGDMHSSNSRDALTASENNVELDEIVVNEVTGERTRRRIKNEHSPDDVEVPLDLEAPNSYRITQNVASQTSNAGGSDLQALGKPSWPQRKAAAFRRVKDLARETVANIRPGVITAAVNFPMVLAVAGGVGAHPYFGLNAAFWAALSATFFAGTRFTIAAPTMLLTSNLVNTVGTYGTYVLPVIALISALLIYLMIFTRAIEFVTFVPSMVTHGVTLGTALLVIIYQLKFALGLAGNIHASSVPYYILEVIEAAIKGANWRAMLMFAIAYSITWAILRWGRGVPVAVILLPLGILTGWILDYNFGNQTRDVPYIETLGTRYGHVEFHPFLLNHWQAALFNWEVIGKAMEISFICVMESYSTAQMTYEITGKRFSKNHEMFSLATANVISGVFGGMPTSVGVTRTLLNIRNGATSRAAGLVNGITLLLFAITMTSFMRFMPMPIIACLQMTAAWRSVDMKVWTKAWNEDRRSTATSLLTAFLCTAVNPFIGLLLGIIISMSIFSRQLSKGHSELTVKTKVHRLQVPSGGTSASYADLPPFDARSRRPSITAIPPYRRNSVSINPSSPPPVSGPLSSTSPPLTGPNPLSSTLHNSPSLTSAIGSSAAPRLARLREARPVLMASLDDMPATRTLSIRHAVAQLAPLLDGSHEQGDDADSSEVRYNVVVYRISGVLTFINAQTHYETLKAITQNKGVTCLILNVRFLYYVDYDGKVVLRNLIKYVDERLDLPTYLVGVTTDLAKQLRRDQWYKDKKQGNLIWKLESDAFKDIQRRNAELIEAGAATTSSISPAPSGVDISTSSSPPPATNRSSTLAQSGFVSGNESSATHGGAASDSTAIPESPVFTIPPSLSRRSSTAGLDMRGSGSIPRSRPIGTLHRQSSSALDRSVLAGSVTSATGVSPAVTPGSGLLSTTAPARSEEVPILTRANSGKTFASRRAVVGLSADPSPTSPLASSASQSTSINNQSNLLDRSDNISIITTEEMEMAIGEAAKSFGLDPAQAVASTEAIIRANRLHREAAWSAPPSDYENDSLVGLSYNTPSRVNSGLNSAFAAAERFAGSSTGTTPQFGSPGAPTYFTRQSPSPVGGAGAKGSSSRGSGRQRHHRHAKTSGTESSSKRRHHAPSHSDGFSVPDASLSMDEAGMASRSRRQGSNDGTESSAERQYSSGLQSGYTTSAATESSSKAGRRGRFAVSPKVTESTPPTPSSSGDMPLGLSRFHHGDSVHSDGGALVESSYEDERVPEIGHSTSSTESDYSDSSSSPSISEDESEPESDHQIVSGPYFAYMSPHEDDGPLHRQIPPPTHSTALLRQPRSDQALNASSEKLESETESSRTDNNQQRLSQSSNSNLGSSGYHPPPSPSSLI